MDLYLRVKAMADERGLSIRSIEIACNFSNGTIKKWATQSPSFDKIVTLADYLKVSLRYLATGEDEPPARPTLTNGEQAILDQVQHLTENQKLQLSGAISMLIAMQNTPFASKESLNDLATVGLFTGSSSRD